MRRKADTCTFQWKIIPSQSVRHLVERSLGLLLHSKVLRLSHVGVERKSLNGPSCPDPRTDNIPMIKHLITEEDVNFHALFLRVEVSKSGRVSKVRRRMDLVFTEPSVIFLYYRIK